MLLIYHWDACFCHIFGKLFSERVETYMNSKTKLKGQDYCCCLH